MLGKEGAVMTTLDDVTKKKQQSAEQQSAVELVRRWPKNRASR
jgi:hypothetical protein